MDPTAAGHGPVWSILAPNLNYTRQDEHLDSGTIAIA
jgi:hypothetical protein